MIGPVGASGARALAGTLTAALSLPPPPALHDERALVAGGPLREAAVLVAITEAPRPAIWLTLRASRLRDHAGQVALPGGRVDPDDTDPVATALREAAEELALPPAAARVLGTADPYHSRTGYRITPVVALVPDALALTPDPAEVAALFALPADRLLDPAAWARHETRWQGRRHGWFDYAHPAPHRVWGVTAGILRNLALRVAAATAGSARADLPSPAAA